MLFALPWMLLGLLGLPALAAIYWLRSRSKPRVVSSLVLWIDQRQPRQGGRIIERMQSPLTLFLELLAIAAIVMAAADPAVTRSQFARPIVVVLDDSYSMRAGGDDTPRKRGGDALLDEFRRVDYVARMILAGAKPRLLGEPVRSADELRGVLSQWTCAAPTAALEQAVALAAEIGGPTARVLVVSDHAARGELSAGQVQWWGFGRPLDNLAFTAASRELSTAGAHGPEDRVLLEVTNFGREPARTEMTLDGANLPAPRRSPIDLGPGEANRVVLNLPSGSATLRAKIGEDALAIDNDVTLVPPNHRLLRVQLAISDAGVKRTGLRPFACPCGSKQVARRRSSRAIRN